MQPFELERFRYSKMNGSARPTEDIAARLYQASGYRPVPWRDDTPANVSIVAVSEAP